MEEIRERTDSVESRDETRIVMPEVKKNKVHPLHAKEMSRFWKQTKRELSSNRLQICFSDSKNNRQFISVQKQHHIKRTEAKSHVV